MDEMINFQPVCRKKGRLIRGAVEVKPSAIHGCGVFADQIIFPGEIVEECPIIFLDFSPTLNFHLFKWDDNTSFMPLGCGAIYNHSTQCNAKFVVDKENRLLKITADKLIYRGDEIFIDYGNAWFKHHNLRDLTDPLSKPVDKIPLQPSSREKNEMKWSQVIRTTILALILVVIYLSTPTISTSHVHSFPAVANVLQQLNSMHLESSSTVQRK